MRESTRFLFWAVCAVGTTACGFPRPADIGDAQTTVDAQTAVDALDSSIDGRLCFGTYLNICLETAPTQPVVISDLTTIETSTSSACSTATNTRGPCVIAGTTISIDAPLRATGFRPLVLIASSSIVVKPLAQIDVSSHHATPLDYGAGGGEATCGSGTPPAAAPGTVGGGAGGSFTGFGGRGGAGGNGGAGGIPNDPVTAVSELRGGCNGQEGNGSGETKGVKGPGGGAVYLIAGKEIDISGAINASGGAGGGGGSAACAGGGGGGSGGMIALDAPLITVSGLLLANGGGGGEGSQQGDTSQNGEEPMTITAAWGGRGGSQGGGDGGDGSAGPAAGHGENASDGANTSGCGGGGGGGAGLVRVPASARLGTRVSPAATL